MFNKWFLYPPNDFYIQQEIYIFSNLKFVLSTMRFRPVETGGAGGLESPQIFANLYFSWIEKNSAKVRNSTKFKTSWNPSKVFDISVITFDPLHQR